MDFLSLVYLALGAFLAHLFIKKVIGLFDMLLDRSGKRVGELLVFRLLWTDSIKKYLPYLGPALVINIFIEEIGISDNFIFWIQQTILALIVILIIILINRILFNISHLPEMEALPNYLGIKVVLEAVKLILYIVAGILVVAYLTKQSLLSIMSALGALTAVLLLVFRDSILGLASGIQISANHMLQIGDWIEIPSHGVDGVVLEIKLTTVKVRNWDNSVVNLPAYSLVQNSFKNWQGMIGSGARRIKRSIYLDTTGIHFLSNKEIDKKISSELKQNSFLKEKLKIITKIKSTKSSVNQHLAKITNAELFRAYVDFYLRHHPEINQDFTLMVRQLQAGPKGIPLEIYAFTRTTDWVKYETIQTEIFEHLYAQAREFGLEVFQDPSGGDFSRITYKPRS